MKKLAIALALVGLGLLVGAVAPGATTSLRNGLVLAGILPSAPAPSAGGHGHGHGHGAGEKEGPEGHVVMSAEQVEAAKITVELASAGPLARRLTVPGIVTPDADRVARVGAKVVGTVAELRKRLGDMVAKDEVVAVLDSREVAEAKSELFSANVNLELNQVLFEREQALWDKKVSAEMQFIKARSTFAEAQLKLDLARQKLLALGLGEAEIAEFLRKPGPTRTASAVPGPAMSGRPNGGLPRYELRSPLAGRVVERKVDLGAPVGGEGQEKELYVIADLSTVWIELAVPTGDLAAIRDGQEISISSGGGAPSKGKIVFVSPILNQETRSARVIASVENRDLTWRPGSYVTAQVTTEEIPVDMRLPRTALQNLKGESVVFVRNEKGFEKREIVLGKTDDQFVEVVFGLDPDDKVAVTNSFVLKAELGKAEAEHAH